MYLFIPCAFHVVISNTKIRYLNVIKSCIADRGLEKFEDRTSVNFYFCMLLA